MLSRSCACPWPRICGGPATPCQQAVLQPHRTCVSYHRGRPSTHLCGYTWALVGNASLLPCWPGPSGAETQRHRLRLHRSAHRPTVCSVTTGLSTCRQPSTSQGQPRCVPSAWLLCLSPLSQNRVDRDPIYLALPTPHCPPMQMRKQKLRS